MLPSGGRGGSRRRRGSNINPQGYLTPVYNRKKVVHTKKPSQQEDAEQRNRDFLSQVRQGNSFFTDYYARQAEAEASLWNGPANSRPKKSRRSGGCNIL